MALHSALLGLEQFYQYLTVFSSEPIFPMFGDQNIGVLIGLQPLLDLSTSRRKEDHMRLVFSHLHLWVSVSFAALVLDGLHLQTDTKEDHSVLMC